MKAKKPSSREGGFFALGLFHLLFHKCVGGEKLCLGPPECAGPAKELVFAVGESFPRSYLVYNFTPRVQKTLVPRR